MRKSSAGAPVQEADPQDHSLLSQTSHEVVDGFNSASIGLHAVGKHLPGPLHRAVEVAEVAIEAVSDHTTGNPIEDAFCGAAGGLAKLGVNAAVMLLPAAKIPGLIQKATVAMGVGMAAQEVLNPAAEFVSETVRNGCHFQFQPKSFLTLEIERRQKERATTPVYKHPPKTTPQRARTPMPTQSHQTELKPIQQSVVTRSVHATKPAASSSAVVARSSAVEVQPFVINPNHDRFFEKIGVIQSRVAEVMTLHENPTIIQLAPHLQTLFPIVNDTLSIAGSFGKDNYIVAQIGGSVAGLERITYGATMLSSTTTAASAATAVSTMGPAMSALTTVAPYITIAAGVATLATSLIGHRKRKGGDNGAAALYASIHQATQLIRHEIQQSTQRILHAMDQLMGSLEQLGQLIEQGLKNQGIMYSSLQSTLQSVMNIEKRLIQQHGENQAALRFMVTESLQNACLDIRADLDGCSDVSLTPHDRGEKLKIIGRWLTHHFKSPTMNVLASGPTSSSELSVGVLNQYLQSPFMMIGYVMVQLQALLGNRFHFPPEFFALPPFELFAQVMQLYFDGIAKAKLPSDDGCAKTCAELEKTTQTYVKLIEFFRNNSEIWTALFNQYEHHRNMVGRTLSEANVPNNSAESLNTLVTGVAYTNLIDALYRMEEKRLLLLVLVNYVNGELPSALRNSVNALESMENILALKGSDVFARRATYYSSITEKNSDKLKLALRAGASLNQPYPVDSVAPPPPPVVMAPATFKSLGIGTFLRTYPNGSSDYVRRAPLSRDVAPAVRAALYPVPMPPPPPYVHSDGNAINRIAHLWESQWKNQP